LKGRLDEVISKNQKAKYGQPGDFVTFLSKTTDNYIIEEIRFLMKKKISKNYKITIVKNYKLNFHYSIRFNTGHQCT